MTIALRLIYPKAEEPETANGVYLYFRDWTYRFFLLATENVIPNKKDYTEIAEEDLNTYISGSNKYFIKNDIKYYILYFKEQTIEEKDRVANTRLDFVFSKNTPEILVINKYAFTTSNKLRHSKWKTLLEMFNCSLICSCFIQVDTDLTTCPIVFMHSNPLFTNRGFTQEEYINRIRQEQSFIDTIQITSEPEIFILGSSTIEANNTVNLIISSRYSDGTAEKQHTYYAEAYAGYLPKKEIEIKDGQGSMLVSALGLKAGDKIRLKINDKYWTDKAEKVLTVV